VNTTLVVVIAAATALIVVAIVAALLTRDRQLPYKRRDYLLTPAERSFWGVLSQVVNGTYHVAWKVRMADLVWVASGTRNRQRHLNRIIAKHLDFVLCDPDSSAPVLAIELDDSSHQEGNRRRRDAFVDAALRDAGLPLLRIPVKRSYVAREIAQLIDAQLGSAKTG